MEGVGCSCYLLPMFVSPRGWVLAPTDLQVVSIDKVGSYCYVTSLFMGCPQFAEQWLSNLFGT